MKSTINKMFVILAIVMSLITVQIACAETVTGIIDSVSVRPPMLVIGETEVSGVRYNYLCNQYNICLEQGDLVSVEYYEYECSDGTTINKACKITVDDATIVLRECQ